MSPFFSAFGEMAVRLVDAGADGLVLFNRFYQPDFDLEKLEVVPDLNLSDPGEIRLPLRWIAILHDRVRASLAATTGVHSADEVGQVPPGRRRRGDDHLGAAEERPATT